MRRGLLAAVAVGACAGALASTASAADLMTNGSFEGSLSGWTAFSGTASLATDGVVGVNAAKVVGTDTRFGIYTDGWPVGHADAGAAYTATAWFRSDQPGPQACLRIREWDASGSTIVAWADSCPTLTQTWQQTTVTYTAHTAGDLIEAYVFEQGAASGKSFEVDAVTLNEGSATPPPTPPDTTITSAPPSTTTSTSATIAFTSTPSGATFQCALDGGAWAACSSPDTLSGLAAGSHTFSVRAVSSAGTDATPASATWTVQASSPPPSGGTNLIANGGFEGSLSNWEAFGGSAALATDAKVGTNAAKVSGTDTRFGLFTDAWPVSNGAAGASYTATAWFRSDQPGPQACVRIREWDASGSTIVDWHDTCATLTTAWAQSTVAYSVEHAGDLLEAYVFEQGAAAGKTFEVDEVTLAPTPAAPAPPPAGDPVLVTAGDIHANCGDSQAPASAKVAGTAGATLYLVLGDQTDNGTAAQYANCFGPTWGAFGSSMWAVAGNHDYDQTNAAPYFQYFGTHAGTQGQGYYSFDSGAWHVVVLNSNCSKIGGCTSTSPQGKWLQQDLAAHPAKCTLAAFHHPLFTSVPEPLGNDSTPQPLWQMLYSAGVDVILNAHTHSYERFAPQDPTGKLDTAKGIREFIVGTGGGAPDGSRSSVAANSQAWDGSSIGVLRLVLHATGYDWSFLPAAGSSYTDSGSASCH